MDAFWIVLWLVFRFLFGIPVVYFKAPLDAALDALFKLKWIPEGWTNYDSMMTFLKFDSAMGLEMQSKTMKLFEQLGEAVPQFAVAVTYYVNNKYYIWWTETTFFSLPTTIISIIFSSVSRNNYRAKSRKRCSVS